MGSLEQCPKGCYCEASSDTHLWIDCAHGSEKAQQLYRQLNSMLSVEHFRERLETLTVINTPLTRVPASVCQMLKLTTLRIQQNVISELPDNCFTKLTKLSRLSLRNNSIVSLQDGLFDGLQSVGILDLSNNQIAFIGLRVFSNASDLTHLRSLNISHNKLTSLEPWWYYRCILGNETSPVRIDLSYNLISNFTNELQLNFRCDMTRPTGYLDLGFNHILYVMDMFQGWNIRLIEFFCLANNHGHSLMRYNIVGYDYACDCTDFPIYLSLKASPRFNIFKGMYCTKDRFQSSMGQKVLASTIPLSEFICELSDRCPSSCRCVYRPANATLHIYCSSANISSLPLYLPPLPKSYVKYKLDFSNNKHLRHLEPRPYFANASILDVSNCRINNVDINAWRELAKMRSSFAAACIYLHNNRITSLPFEVTSINSNSVIFTLYNNPWDCSCKNRWMITWFKSLSLQSSNGDDAMCASPLRLKGRSIAQSTEYDFCVDPAQRMLKISLPSVLCPVFVLLIIGFAVYRLRVRLYRRWKFHPFDRDECVEEDMDNDVFLCCSSEDDFPHGRRIVELIESNGYRVCYHERDFLPGQLITDNMGQAIERSKRTVCLISRNFLRRLYFSFICQQRFKPTKFTPVGHIHSDRQSCWVGLLFLFHRSSI